MKKAYPKYRELPFPWPNRIPAGWELAKVSSAFTERKETVSDKDYEPLSVTKEGIVPQLESAAKTDNGDNRKKVLAGDFVINSRSDRKGSSGLSKYDGSVSVINTVLKPLQDKAEGKYIEYLLKNYFFQEEFYRYGKGIVDDLWSTKYSNMKGMPIPLPSLPEQRQIAAFLDHKCASIDTFIQKKTRLIGLLKEQKQAIINKAVTKGIDPNVRLKPSDIDWLGDIPEHWEVKKLKYLVRHFSEQTSQFAENEKYLGMENIESWTGCYLKSEEEQSLEGQAKRFFPGYVLFGKLRPYLAKVWLADFQGVCSGEFLTLKPNEKLEAEFLKMLLLGKEFIDLVNSSTYGAKMPRASWNFIGNINLAIPSVEEQRKIVAVITSESETTDRTIQKIEKEIELVREYKTTLIAEAVTGKIDVRDWKPKQVADETEQTLNQIQAYGPN